MRIAGKLSIAPQSAPPLEPLTPLLLDALPPEEELPEPEPEPEPESGRAGSIEEVPHAAKTSEAARATRKGDRSFAIRCPLPCASHAGARVTRSDDKPAAGRLLASSA